MKTFKLFTKAALVILTLSPLTALSQTPPATGAVTNAEKSGKPGETSTTPSKSSSTGQSSSVGNSSAGGVTTAEKSAKPGETSATPRISTSPAPGSAMSDTSGQGTGAVTSAERSRKADRN